MTTKLQPKKARHPSASRGQRGAGKPVEDMATTPATSRTSDLSEFIDALQGRNLSISEGEIRYEGEKVLAWRLSFRSPEGMLSKAGMRLRGLKFQAIAGAFLQLFERFYHRRQGS